MKVPSDITVRAALNEAAFVLSEAGIHNARHEARLLAEHILGHRLGVDERFTGEEFRDFLSLVGARAQRIPLQHVMGVAYFRRLTLRVRAGVFVPRPETEMVAEEAIAAAREWVARGVAPRVLDVGCGSAALGLSIASEVPQAVLTCIDIDAAAVALTRENAVLVGVDAEVLCADVTSESLSEKFHVIASNPPYVVAPVSQPEAARDPALALYGGGADGLDKPRAFLRFAAPLLVAGGTLVMEHAESQAAALVAEARALGLSEAVTGYDLAHRPRYLRARS